jgi:hypothetical protein
VNLLSLCFIGCNRIRGDFFVLTGGLSESSRRSRDLALSQGRFGAKHLLLGYQDTGGAFPFGGRVGVLAARGDAVIEDINFLPGNHYAFRWS